MKNNPCENCICNVDEYCRCEKLSLYESYQQGRADEIEEELYEYAFWLFTNYSGGGAVGGSVAHDNAVKSIEEFKQWQKGNKEC